MDGLSQLGQIFSNPGALKGIEGGTLAAGEVGNIMEERKRLAYQNFVMDLLSHPEKLAAMAAKIQQPLNNGLVQGVNNRVQGDMAARGLSQAPGIFAASEGQALAPYVQQNQQTAMQAVLSSLGLPAGTFGQPQNLSSLMTLFAKPQGGSAPAPGLTPDPSQLPPPISPGGDMPA